MNNKSKIYERNMNKVNDFKYNLIYENIEWFEKQMEC